MSGLYLERYAWQEPVFPAYVPGESLELIVVIPVYKEPDLMDAMRSLDRCDRPRGGVLIIVIVNEPEHAGDGVSMVNGEVVERIKREQWSYEVLVSYQKLPRKKAGVGLARKIGMDEAVRIFERSGNDGVIICYDADCLCEPNYLTEIERAYLSGDMKAGIVFFEHVLSGENREAILHYELYLRYYVNALRYAGFPYAHQTLGSCITVRSSVYQLCGGMNTRKAGEDFYFLNKVIPHGDFSEINSTTIRPSDRASDRVPFGTGKAVSHLLSLEGSYEVYHPNTFQDLGEFFENALQLWEKERVTIPSSVRDFLGDDYVDQLMGVKSQTASFASFRKRFFHWFDAFKILKFVHHARDHFYPNVPLTEALDWLETNYTGELSGDLGSKLEGLRAFDRNFC